MPRTVLAGAVLAIAVLAGCSAGESPAAPTPVVQAAKLAPPPGWSVGESRPHTLFTHCGIRSAQLSFDVLWPVVGTPPAPQPQQVAPGGPVTGNELQGTLTLVEPELARFIWDGGTVDFAPGPNGPPCA